MQQSKFLSVLIYIQEIIILNILSITTYNRAVSVIIFNPLNATIYQLHNRPYHHEKNSDFSKINSSCLKCCAQENKNNL